MKTRTMLTLCALGVAGLIFAFGDLLIPQENLLFEAQKNPKEFSHLVTSQNYSIWAARGFIGVILEMIGTIGLYLYLQRKRFSKIAFAGFVFTLMHHVLGCGVFAIAFFMFPALGNLYLNGSTQAIEFAAFSQPTLGLFFMVSMATTLIGLALMAIAVQKSNDLPKYSGWLAFVGFALIPFPGVMLQFMANLLWSLAYFWMAFHLAKKKTLHFNTTYVAQ